MNYESRRKHITKLADTGPEALGFVYRRTDGVIVFVTSACPLPHRWQQVIMHELYHILEHLPNMQQIVGVNMIDELFEEKADGFVGGGSGGE